MHHPIARLHDRITRFGFYLGGATLCGIVACFWIEVVARYFFNAPTLWSSSLVAYFLCIAVSLSVPELARTNGHIAITVLPERLSPASRQRYDRMIALAAGVVCTVAAWILIQETLRQFGSGTTTALGLDIPKYWVSIFICYAFINTALYFLRYALFPGIPHDGNEQQEV
ncbi:MULTISPECIES: TRAP transporter small permease subunit [Halomonadaceae]|uniref:TRAP transporter small permease protein n=2 Tax=Vreelandella TaxID=3137766 RepID=A0A7Z0RXR2_9GAMM|nr:MULTISPECIES: TRAP transporter small permease subunit [Halomonas]AJY48962.1 Tripartite ATP-independent periplasmic transporter DctQ component [Halomonas sp. KO116]NYS77594.1 TRAP transporter small permease [Halomonas glaciei]|tara:strand:+ start:6309 stop:6818 length:510 start_codon:yes stop_codon:yes gene_type:complete